MNRIRLRMCRNLLLEVQADLARPHPIAFERVGFMYGRTERLAGDDSLVVARAYEPVLDEHYIRDLAHGATIGGDAIRRALGHALRTGDSVIHVHQHLGSPYPSGTDSRTYRELTPTFVAAAPRAAHGGLILGDEDAYCLLWPPPDHLPVSSHVRVVGFPMAIWEAKHAD